MDSLADKYLIRKKAPIKTEKIIEQINNSKIIDIDESQIRKIKSHIYIGKYLIEYEYETMRKNKKTNKKIVIQTSKENAEIDFWRWVDCTNDEAPVRRISNVQILGINDIGGETIEL